MLRYSRTLILVVLIAASCTSSDSSALEDELTSDIESTIEALNTFTVNREAQIERPDMQNPDFTLGEFLAAAEESLVMADLAVVDSAADSFQTIAQRARDNDLERINGVSVDDLELYAASARVWSIAEAPQGRPFLDCIVTTTAGLDPDTPMNTVIQDQVVVDCLLTSLATAQESLDAQAEVSRYVRRINRDWEG
jgi:hypothetical protein